MQIQSNHLIIFARFPEPGLNKTRLIPAIGMENATLFYRILVERTLARVRQLLIDNNCFVTIHFTGGALKDIQAEFGVEFTYREQIGSSLGDRLQFAIASAHTDGAQKIIVIGTDCPSLTSNDLSKAFNELDKHDVVIGPAFDGGYYLIGLSEKQPGLFAGVDWGTAAVFEQTIQKARVLELSVGLLRDLPDVDYPENMLPMRRSEEDIDFPIKTVSGRVSVVIPTLNEETNLPATLHALGKPQHDLEIIIVDAGSTDRTLAIAEQHGCKAFIGNRGRALQMNAGAAIATGEYLLFLHADTLVPDGYRNELKRVLSTAVQCGAFPLQIAARGIALRVIEAGVAFRSKFLQMPYGDQALFFRASDFYDQDGFKPMAIMEDYDLIARMRKLGRIGLAVSPVQTSARRWLRKGVLRTTMLNQLCVLAYRCGCSDKTICRLYHGTGALFHGGLHSQKK